MPREEIWLFVTEPNTTAMRMASVLYVQNLSLPHTRRRINRSTNPQVLLVNGLLATCTC